MNVLPKGFYGEIISSETIKRNWVFQQNA